MHSPRFFRATPLALAAAACLALAPAAAAVHAQKKPEAKKPAGAKPAAAADGVVRQSTQLPGEFGKFGTVYAVGREAPLHVTLKSAEYLAGRVEHNNKLLGYSSAVPSATEKLLVLRFRVQNPNRGADVRVFDGALNFTVVGPTDENYEPATGIMREGTIEGVDQGLKPAQAMDLYLAFKVPAAGEMPKLIVRRGSDEAAPVVRYDLRGKVKPLPAPYADPSDARGATPPAAIPARAATYYPLLHHDVRFDGAVTFGDQAVANQKPPEGMRWAVVGLTFRGDSSNAPLGSGSLLAKLKTEDGETFGTFGFDELVQASLLRAGRDAAFDGPIPRSEEQKARLFFAVPTGAKIKSLSLAPAQPDWQGRPYIFDLAGDAQ